MASGSLFSVFLALKRFDQLPRLREFPRSFEGCVRQTPTGRPHVSSAQLAVLTGHASFKNAALGAVSRLIRPPGPLNAKKDNAVTMRPERKLLLAATLTLILPQALLAEEGPFLWKAERVGSSITIRSGLSAPEAGRPSFGIESNLDAAGPSATGTRVVPLRLWSEIDLDRRDRTRFSAGAKLDARNGAGRVYVQQVRRVELASLADLELDRTLETSRSPGEEPVYRARQALRLSLTEWQATVVADVTLENRQSMAAGMSMSRKLAPGVSLSATVSDLSRRPKAVIWGRLQRDW
ncbi:hypothetical protein ACSV9I_22095 [Rhizobium sp. G187]|uniref:hypothetical protein n=1 Tax=Rhizobium sp. G187 TaxID=3451352 RepID=UPI003EE63763